MSRVFVIIPVGHVEVVLEVTQSTALFLAKAAVPLALGQLSASRLQLSRGFQYLVSFKLGAFLAPSICNSSPYLVVCNDVDSYSVLPDNSLHFK